MKAKIMDASHLLLILSAREVLCLGLSGLYEKIPRAVSRITLAKVFLDGCKYTGFCYQNAKNILIRTLPMQTGGIALLFCLQGNASVPEKRKRFQIKQIVGPYIYRFETCTDMMNAAEHLHKAGLANTPDAKLLQFGQHYRIILELKWQAIKHTKAILREYGTFLGKGRIAAATCLEHGTLLTNNLFGALFKTPPSSES